MAEWQLQTVGVDATIVKFHKDFLYMATLLDDKDIDEVVNVQIDTKTLNLIKKFCEDHKYSKDSVQVKKPLVSNIFKDNIDAISFKIFKELHGISKVEEIKVILEAAYYLDFDVLKDCCFCALALDLYVGNTDEDLTTFAKKHNIGDMSPAEELAIMVEFEQIFKALNLKLREDMMQEEEKYKQQVQVNGQQGEADGEQH